MINELDDEHVYGYLAVDPNGDEWIYEREIERGEDMWYLVYARGDRIKLPKGMIERMTGRKITWDDEPIEIKDF